jgi:hypothetical protein
MRRKILAALSKYRLWQNDDLNYVLIVSGEDKGHND